MDESRKTEEAQEKSILCHHENANIHKLSKESSRKRKTRLDECESSLVVGREKNLEAVSRQRREIGSKKRKLDDGSMTSFATVEGEESCGEKEEPSSTSIVGHVELSSRSSPLKKSKAKKSRYEKDVSENEVVHVNTTVEVLTDGCGKKKKKKKRSDKHLASRSPLLVDNDLVERLEENQMVSYNHIEICMNVTYQKKIVETCNLNCKSVENAQKAVSREVAESSLSENLDLPRCEEGDLMRNNRKSRKTKEGRNQRDVQLSCASKPTVMAFENEKRKKKTTKEKLVENVQKAASHGVAESSLSENLDLPRSKEDNSLENNRESRKTKGGRNRNLLQSQSAMDVQLSCAIKPTVVVFENEKRKKRTTKEEFVATDSKSSVNNFNEADKSLANEHLMTKTNKRTKRKADGDHVIVAMSLLSESPRGGNSVAWLTETGVEDQGVSDSPKKKGKSSRLADAESAKEENAELTGLHWLKPAASNAGVPRPNKNLFRRKMRCPVDGCLGRSTRINRHILNCHPELEISEREKLVQKIIENPCDFLGAVPSAPVVPVLKRRLRCPVDGCTTKTVRMRRHLVERHLELTPAEREDLWEKISQHPMEYVYPLATLTSVKQEDTEVRKLKTTSAGIPRPNFKVRSRRVKQNCPVSGCQGHAINMRRHLEDCHSAIADEHEQLLEKLIEQRREQRAANKKALKVEKDLKMPGSF